MSKGVLAGYEPAGVLGFFEDICAIPHGSGNEAALADYVENFACERGLYCYRDAVHNVFIRLPAAKGCEDAPAVMLQGHLDMVCEQDEGGGHDFLSDGLDLLTKDGWICARGTTLGGDDGIAVAMMLDMLDNPPERHPVIECLFTVSEEIGLEGAHAFDPAAVELMSRTMINLDSEAEDVVTAGCAGGMRTDIMLPVESEPLKGVAVKIELSGFSGGHSGVEISEGHINAVKALGRVLGAMRERYDIALISIDGGGKDNAIPRDACAVVSVSDGDSATAFCGDILAEAERLRAEPHVILADRNFTCTVEVISSENAPKTVITPSSVRQIMAILALARDGVLAMNAHVEGMVAYSRNMGIVMTLYNGEGKPVAVQFSFSTRSACESHLDDAARELSELSAVCTGGVGSVKHHARYPGWEYAPVSPLRDLWCKTAAELYGKDLRVEAIHAGLECGILCAKVPGMDIISVGPDMRDIHTPRERLSIVSVERVYDILRKVCSTLGGHE